MAFSSGYEPGRGEDFEMKKAGSLLGSMQSGTEISYKKNIFPRKIADIGGGDISKDKEGFKDKVTAGDCLVCRD